MLPIGVVLLILAAVTDVGVLWLLGLVLVVFGAVRYIASVRHETWLGRRYWR